ncbi:MAG: Do family serine endopeptidase [Succinatimonas sp.]|nr:Do family serine endopeptidase [Succinatimonas sp.]
MKKYKNTLLAAGLALSLAVSSVANASAPLFGSLEASGQLPTLAPMIKQVIPGVVNISVKGKKNVQTFQLPEEFRFFFPGMDLGQKQERQFQALGSGVIINAKKGYVVTNFHVIDDANEIKVATSDGREFEAKLVGADEHTDLALLELKDASNLTEIAMTDSDNIEVGDFAVAIGNPYGLGQTVTSGIVSALGRSGLNIENIENFIQTDAAINSGNSGGALLNLKGELIGINTAIMAPSGGNIGIGFAIPTNMVKNVVNQLLDFGEVKRGMLGVTGTELNADLAQNFGYDKLNGAFVNEVQAGSAADKAGIKSGDIITSINGKEVTSFGQLRAIVATQRAGSKVQIGLFRDGRQMVVDVTLDENSVYANAGNASELSQAFSGAKLANAKDSKGVEITSVEKGSIAQRLGLKEGDIITAVNRAKVKNLNDLKKNLEGSKGKINALRIQRGETELYITIR